MQSDITEEDNDAAAGASALMALRSYSSPSSTGNAEVLPVAQGVIYFTSCNTQHNRDKLNIPNLKENERKHERGRE